MEQEMSSLLKLSHRNLLHYLAFKYEEEAGKITIYVSIANNSVYKNVCQLYKL